MGDILGDGRTSNGRPADSRGYVGFTYKVTPLLEGKALKEQARKIREEMRVELAGEQATNLAVQEAEFMQTGDELKVLPASKAPVPGFFFVLF